MRGVPWQNGAAETPNTTTTLTRVRLRFAAWEADTSDDVMKEHGVYWQASDNDPRVGQVWFTGFYCISYYDFHGIWRE